MSVNRRMVGLAVSSMLVAGALVGPSMASAKKIKINCTVPNNKLTGTKLSGKFSCSSPKSTGTESGIGTPPVLKVVFNVKGGGTIKILIKDGTLKGSAVVGTGKVTGTGKYKKLKGKVKINGSIATNKYVYTGTGTM
jgi:hypothetical protein